MEYCTDYIYNQAMKELPNDLDAPQAVRFVDHMLRMLGMEIPYRMRLELALLIYRHKRAYYLY